MMNTENKILTTNEKNTLLKEANNKWKEYIENEFSKQDFKYLMYFSEEVRHFMRNLTFTDLKWEQNYLWGENVDFKMKAEFNGEKLYIRGVWKLHAYPEKPNKPTSVEEDSYYFLTGRPINETDELFAQFLDEVGFRELLIQFDGHNWSPEPSPYF